MKSLTKTEKRALFNSLSATNKAKVVSHCAKCLQRGDGFFDVIKNIGSKLGSVITPVLKILGPTLAKEILVPMIKKKYNLGGSGINVAGNGISLAGNGKKKRKKRQKGGTLRLAGQGLDKRIKYMLR